MGIVNGRTDCEHHRHWPVQGINLFDERGHVPVADDQHFEPEVATETFDGKCPAFVGDGPFAAVGAATGAECAVALLHTGVVHHDCGMLQRLAGSVGNLAGECRAVGGA